MSLLVETRQRARKFHWDRTGPLREQVEDLIETSSSVGLTNDTLLVTREEYKYGVHLIEALNLEGFQASWTNEGCLSIEVSWAVRHPR